MSVDGFCCVYSITVYQNQLAQEWQIPKENQSIFDRSGWEPEPERLILENVMGKPSLEAGDGQVRKISGWIGGCLMMRLGRNNIM